MESVIRALVIYFFLLLIFRVGGKRTLSQTTPFDLILMLIISESVQEAIIGEDHSLTNAFVIIITLVTLDIGLSYVKQYAGKAKRILEGEPLLLVEHGKLLQEPMRKARIDDDDILEAARLVHGIGKLEQIKYAILEVDGNISIIPQEK